MKSKIQSSFLETIQELDSCFKTLGIRYCASFEELLELDLVKKFELLLKDSK